MTARSPLGIADGHNDLLMAVHHRRERGDRDPFGDFWLPQLRDGNVVVQIMPIFTEEQFAAEGALRRALLLLESARELAAVHEADVAIVETAAQLDAALEGGRIAIVLGVEGLEPVGPDLEVLETFWRLGVRTASLTWNRRTLFADGVGERDTGGRLTQLGIEAVAAMERLGMAIDISHLSATGVSHIAEIASRPFFASHSSCQSLCDHPRNLTDHQLALVAASGGCVGINAFGPFIDAGKATVERYIDHVEHAITVIGDGHVALGADFVKDLFETVDAVLGKALVDIDDIPMIEGLVRPADYVGLGDRLRERLGDDSAERVAAGNLIEFLRASLPASG